MSKNTQYFIDRVSKKELEPLLLTYHYLKDESKSYKSGFNYGLFKYNEWECPLRISSPVACCIFTGFPVPEIAVGAFGLQRHEQEGLYELSRLCVHPDIQKTEYNITSWFVSRCIKRFRKDANVRCILSYADANHHTGVIYRACNFTYYGLTDPKKDFYYADGTKALKNISLPVYEDKITALIGPSGCGKSTFLRCFNRMHDLYPGNRYDGQILLYPDNTNVLAKGVDPIEVRMRISMVFQKPNPFPKSIYENVAYGLRVRGEKSKTLVDEKVEEALKGASLWNEVKDRLHDLAFNLSGGQQQRLCIARALATDPEIMLFDEPTSALDPIATVNIEELMSTLKDKLSILVVTHNMQQAARISDYTAYMYLGEMIEFDATDKIFTNPSKKETEDYITGKFG